MRLCLKTEHPDVSLGSSFSKITVNKYLKACRRIEGIVVVSQNLKQYFVENGCVPNRVHIVNMIVDTSRFERLER